MSIFTQNLYFSAASNRSSNSIDLSDDLLLYGASNCVILYDHKKRQCVDKLEAHTGLVNSVKWIKPDHSFVSTSGDKTSIIWIRDGLKFVAHKILSGHSDSILVADTVEKDEYTFLSCTSANDQTLGIWKDDQNLVFQKNKFFVFDVKIVIKDEIFTKGQTLILLAASDSKVHLFQLNQDSQLFPILQLEGHHEWIRSVDFIFTNDGSMMIASGCQDNFIRIWKAQKEEKKLETDSTFTETLPPKPYSVSVETLIAGHEDKIYCVKWIRDKSERLRLLSTSTDRTAIVWEQPNDSDSSVWFEKYRFGEISGNNLGFLSGAISPDGQCLVVNSYNGALHLWKLKENVWHRDVVVTGHFGEVSDIRWSPDGSYLLSCSTDQTTRLHAKWALNDSWHEIARPQVHGYEMNCLAPISPLYFVSGADEKVMRVFQATKCFVKSFKSITGIDLESFADGDRIAEFASVPLLGLSNVAVYDASYQCEDKIFKPVVYEEPPTEESLLQNTFWSEHQKLYGHGYELFALDVNRRRTFIASACKATNEQDAAICIWDICNGYKLVARLLFHRLTITKLSFSPDNRYLVSVSRDRNWQMYSFDPEKGLSEPQQPVNQASRPLHSRVIWDVCWTPDSKLFLTVSRDKRAIFWKPEIIDQTLQVRSLSFTFTASDSINCCAISSLPPKNGDEYLVALGLENGSLLLTTFHQERGWVLLHETIKLHTLPIKRISFNPANGEQLATGGSDGFVRILKLVDC